MIIFSLWEAQTRQIPEPGNTEIKTGLIRGLLQCKKNWSFQKWSSLGFDQYPADMFKSQQESYKPLPRVLAETILVCQLYALKPLGLTTVCKSEGTDKCLHAQWLSLQSQQSDHLHAQSHVISLVLMTADSPSPGLRIDLILGGLVSITTILLWVAQAVQVRRRRPLMLTILLMVPCPWLCPSAGSWLLYCYLPGATLPGQEQSQGSTSDKAACHSS